MVNAAKQAQAPNTLVLKTMQYYVISFRKDVLPMRRHDDSQLFSWKNDAVLDRILAFNAALNQSKTLQSIRHEMAEMEQKAAEAILRNFPSITRYTYSNVGRLVESAEQDMQTAAAKHQEICAALKEKEELLETGEHIMGGGLVAELIAKETRRRQSDIVPSGYVRSDTIRR